MLTKQVQESENQAGVQQLATLDYAFRWWWVVGLCILVGGLLAWGLWALQPPIYEAVAQMIITIDFRQTGPISQYDEDVAVNTAGNLLTSEALLLQVVDQANAEGLSVGLEDLKKQVLLERKFSQWNLRVRDANPHTAEQLANLWLKTGQVALLQYHQHAIQADLLSHAMQSLERCFESTGADQPALAHCDGAHRSEIQKAMQATGAALFNERQASQNMFAGLLLGPFHPAQPASQPVATGRNQALLLGSLVGLLVGVVLSEWGLRAFFRKRKQPW